MMTQQKRKEEGRSLMKTRRWRMTRKGVGTTGGSGDAFNNKHCTLFFLTALSFNLDSALIIHVTLSMLYHLFCSWHKFFLKSNVISKGSGWI